MEFNMKNATIALLLICTAAFAQQKGTFKDSRDGKTYKTVKIGKLTWMAENLNYAAPESKCYDDKPDNCEKYGRLYRWADAREACPSGWHFSKNDEWMALMKVAATDGFVTMAGTNLKAKSGWDRDDKKNKDGNGTDKYGFSALPGGYCSSKDKKCNYFDRAGTIGYWWTADMTNIIHSPYWRIIYNNENLYTNDTDRYDFHSVRCVQD
jgi:uncharacterized protein (TIGR02145 family)